MSEGIFIESVVGSVPRGIPEDIPGITGSISATNTRRIAAKISVEILRISERFQ